MAIYVCGDTHGFNDYKKLTRKWQKHASLDIQEGDYVIICGDWGGNWNEPNDEVFRWWEARPWTTVIVLGNHDNYNIAKTYPLVTWNGALCRELSKNKVYIVERGQILTLEEKTFFCFGGAQSHDISDGIVDRNDYADFDDKTFKKIVKTMERKGKQFRIRDIDWWDEEIPTAAEIHEAKLRLAAEVSNGRKIDYLITHCLDTEALNYLSYILQKLLCPDTCTDAIYSFKKINKFKAHFCGHYHVDEIIYLNNSYTTILYNKIIKI